MAFKFTVCILLIAVTCHLTLSHDSSRSRSSRSSACSSLLSNVAKLADGVDDITCEEVDILTGKVFGDCKVYSPSSAILAVKSLYDVFEDKDCDKSDDYQCIDEMECLEDLFDRTYRIDCGDDDDDILEDARECIEKIIDDDDSDCEYLDDIDDILASDTLCSASSYSSYRSRPYRRRLGFFHRFTRH